ncbi:hypothetical protein N7527_000604 [Penicillium freii]|nr:hypothetical protein N7527_000604 [Penicillium freii]
MAETLAGQVAQLTEQQKKANSQSATNPDVGNQLLADPAKFIEAFVQVRWRFKVPVACALGFRRGSLRERRARGGRLPKIWLWASRLTAHDPKSNLDPGSTSSRGNPPSVPVPEQATCTSARHGSQ